MATREPKSNTVTTITVVGRTGEQKGHLELTSGNVYYFRKKAETPTLRMTYQQLFTILEREIEYQSIETKTYKLPKPHHDRAFSLCVDQRDETEVPRFPIESTIPLNKLDPRCIDLGTYQFSDDMAKGFSMKRPRRYYWFAHVSVQATLWILNRYVDKFLVGKKMSAHEDEDIVVSKEKMREVFLMLFKKVDS